MATKADEVLEDTPGHAAGDDDIIEEVSSDAGGETGVVPSLIREFLGHFFKQVYEGTQFDIQAFYETNFNKLTERFYPNSSWPSADAIAQYVDNGTCSLRLDRASNPIGLVTRKRLAVCSQTSSS